MKTIQLCVLSVVLSVSISVAQQAKGEGRGLDYHFALFLDFQHASDHAKALFNQTLGPNGMNMDLVKEHVDEIGKCLENARIHHRMVHLAYTPTQQQEIESNHKNFLQNHTNANEAFANLKAEIAKREIDTQKIKRLSAMIYEETNKAVLEHKDALKKLGIDSFQIPS